MPAFGSGQETAKRIFDSAIEACGGKAGFQALENVVWRGKVRSSVAGTKPEMDYRFVLAMPDRVRLELKGAVEVTQVGDPKEFVLVTPLGTQALPERMKRKVFDGLWRELPYLFHRSEEVVETLRDGGEKLFLDQTCRVVEIDPPAGGPFQLFVNLETRLPAGIIHQFEPMTGAGETSAESRVIFEDYRKVSGLRLPFSTRIEHNGEIFQEIAASSIEVNANLSATEFAPGR